MIKLGELILGEDGVACHVHCYGKSGFGKSKCIECICRTLAGRKHSFIFLDPHGHTVADLLKWLAFWKPKRKKVYLLDTSERERIVGLGSFFSESKDEDELATAVGSKVAATMKAWGHDPLATPRLTKWLKRLYRTILEQDLPLTAVDCFLEYRHPDRAKILQGASEEMRRYWEALYKLPQKEFANYLESAESRLEMFKHPQLRRILSVKENSLDLKKIWENGDILLVSLQPSKVIGEEENRVIGSLLINDLVQIALQRKPEDKSKLFLIIDECWRYLTPSFRSILDETRKYNLFLWAFHQRLDQLDRQTASALQNAKTKIIFSTDEDPKPERYFDLITKDGTRQSSQMQNIQEYHVKPEKVEAYRRSLLEPFLTLKEVDRKIRTFEEEEELDDEDFYRN